MHSQHINYEARENGIMFTIDNSRIGIVVWETYSQIWTAHCSFAVHYRLLFKFLWIESCIQIAPLLLKQSLHQPDRFSSFDLIFCCWPTAYHNQKQRMNALNIIYFEWKWTVIAMCQSNNREKCADSSAYVTFASSILFCDLHSHFRRFI